MSELIDKMKDAVTEFKEAIEDMADKVRDALDGDEPEEEIGEGVEPEAVDLDHVADEEMPSDLADLETLAEPTQAELDAIAEAELKVDPRGEVS